MVALPCTMCSKDSGIAFTIVCVLADLEMSLGLYGLVCACVSEAFTLSMCQTCGMDSQLRSKRRRRYGHVCRMLDTRFAWDHGVWASQRIKPSRSTWDDLEWCCFIWLATVEHQTPSLWNSNQARLATQGLCHIHSGMCHTLLGMYARKCNWSWFLWKNWALIHFPFACSLVSFACLQMPCVQQSNKLTLHHDYWHVC